MSEREQLKRASEGLAGCAPVPAAGLAVWTKRGPRGGAQPVAGSPVSPEARCAELEADLIERMHRG